MTKKSRRQQRKVAANSSASTRTDRSVYGGGTQSTNYGYWLNPGYHAGDQKRNVWEAVGYPQNVNFDMLWRMSTRGIGKAGIHRLVNKCWEKDPTITDGKNDGKRPLTPFEQDLEVLVKEHHLFARLKGADWRNRVGRYAGIIPIVREDGKSDTEMSKLGSVKSILKLVPVFESQIDVTDIGTNSNLNDVNFGMPKYYNYRENVSGDRNPVNNNQFELHPSRVFVFAEGADDGSIYGVPVNEAGFNALLDMEKSSGAGAEGLYKNAKQRTVLEINDKQVANVISTDPAKKQAFDDNVQSFERDMDGFLTLYGMTAKTLQSTIADPTNPWTVALNTYCATIEIPATILIGQQTGRLASDEDQKDWGLTAQSRCENVLTPSLVVPFLKYMIDIGALRPPSNDINVEWPNFVEASPAEKLANGKLMGEVNKLARDAGVSEAVFTHEEIREASGYDPEPEGDLETFGETEGTTDDNLPAVDENL